MGVTSQFGAEVSLVFPGSLDEVWRVVSDVTRIGEWSPECHQVQWVDGATAPGPGAVFIGRNRVGLLRWQTRCTMVAWQPEYLLSYEARHVTGASTRWTFALEEGSDGVVVTQGFQTVGSPRFMIVLDRMARRPMTLRRDMRRTLEGMAAAVRVEMVHRGA